MANGTEEKKSKRNAMATKGYILPDGEVSKSARENATGLTFTFGEGGGDAIAIAVADFESKIRACAMLHGFAQKLGDSYAGSADAAEARESFDAMLERLLSGEWVSERKATGPSATILVDAISHALTKAGKPVDVKSIREKVAGKEGRERALANPVIAAEYENIRAERALAKAAEADKKAEGASLEEF